MSAARRRPRGAAPPVAAQRASRAHRARTRSRPTRATLAGRRPTPHPAPRRRPGGRARALSLQLNAINFGSGWFPTLRKPRRAARASARSRPACARRARGRADELRRSTPQRVAADARPGPGPRADGALRRRTCASSARASRRARRRVPRLATRGDGSAVRLAEHLADAGRRLATIPFFKRAQIAAADLALRRPRARRDLEPPDAVRRQPRPPRAAPRRRPRLRRRSSSRASTPASCSSTTRPRRSRSARARVHAVELLVAAHGDHRAPRSTTCSGTAARSRATRRTRATARAAPPTEALETTDAPLLPRRSDASAMLGPSPGSGRSDVIGQATDRRWFVKVVERICSERQPPAGFGPRRGRSGTTSPGAVARPSRQACARRRRCASTGP